MPLSTCTLEQRLSPRSTPSPCSFSGKEPARGALLEKNSEQSQSEGRGVLFSNDAVLGKGRRGGWLWEVAPYFVISSGYTCSCDPWPHGFGTYRCLETCTHGITWSYIARALCQAMQALCCDFWQILVQGLLRQDVQMCF